MKVAVPKQNVCGRGPSAAWEQTPFPRYFIGRAVGVALRSKQAGTEGVKAPYPGFIEPALGSAAGRVPAGDRWIHEIKFDRYRAQVHIANEAVKVFTRRGNDWTHRLRKIANDAWHVTARSAIIDGEIVVPSADGTTDFSVLQNELKGNSAKIVFVAFDLLYFNGRDLRKTPLLLRQAILKKIIAKTDLQFSESLKIDGKEMLAHACKVGLEGVVSKVRDSLYVSGRNNDWVKKTCVQRETLSIAGFALEGNDWDGLYLGRRRGNDFVYAGKVDHGFDKTSAGELRRRLTPLTRGSQPYSKRIGGRQSPASRLPWLAGGSLNADEFPQTDVRLRPGRTGDPPRPPDGRDRNLDGRRRGRLSRPCEAAAGRRYRVAEL